jgi:hypothetical protein
MLGSRRASTWWWGIEELRCNACLLFCGMSNAEAKELKIGFKHLALAGLLILALWMLISYLAYKFSPNGQYGTFGDMFGVVNSLFSGLAFACLILATMMQREELKLQRKELQLARMEAAATRKEIEGQKEQAIAQNETLRQQTFDNTFFQLLRLHNDIVSAIDIRRTSTRELQGRDCFKFFFGKYKEFYGKLAIGLPATSPEELAARIEVGYSAFFKQYEADLGHYFRSVYNIVKFVDRSDIKETDKRLYTNLVRAQLSNYELRLMFYNCVSHFGSERFKPLVEKYGLLKHFDFGDAIHGEEDRRLFEDGAF